MGEETLLRVKPPRLGEFTLLSFENLLESLDAEQQFSLELVAEHRGVSMLVRSEHPDRVAQQLRSHYPEVELEHVQDCDDPMEFGDGERVWTQTLLPDGDEWLPLQVYDDTGLLDHGSDPFADVLGGLLTDVRPGERIVSRLMLKQKDHAWSEAWRARAMSGAGSENQQATEAERIAQQLRRAGRTVPAGGGNSGGGTDGGANEPFSQVLLFLLVGGMGLLLAGYWFMQLWQSGRFLELALYALLGTALVGLVAYALWKLGFFGGKPKQVYYDPQQVATRVSGSAFMLEVRLYAIVGNEARASRARELLEPVVGAYRGFDNPLGCRFAVGELTEVTDKRAEDKIIIFESERRKRSIFSPPGGGKGVVGVREVAALWHLPGESSNVEGLERAGSRRLPVPQALNAGAPVGQEQLADGGVRVVRFPSEARRRHHLYVARTQMGKSTLMSHVVGNRLLEKAAGRDDDAVVVVDPHADLVESILESVPNGLGERVRLIDLGDRERSCGINLLDVHVFRNRDTTVDTIVRVAHGLWDQWGSRMQAILEHTLKALYEANRTLARDEQYTLLDARLMLTDETFRNRALRRVQDPYILDWWQSDFGNWRSEYLADSVAPVQTRLAYYAASASARNILGQRSCTLHVSEVIRQGDVLLVSTDQGAVGQDVAALVGAAMLNLVESVVRRQGESPASERRGAMVVVDEMQSIPGVRYESMLSELGKFGGVLVLATQSLSKLDELSPTMRDTLLSNIGCLCVFQVNAVDASRLLPELDGEHLDEEDITGLPVHHCYGRLNVGGNRPAYFSMQLLPPLRGASEAADAIRKASDAYTRPTSVVAGEQAQYMDDQVQNYRDRLDSAGDRGLDFGQGDRPARGGRRRGRRKKKDVESDAGREAAD